ncbi:MAG: hypothetical protein HYV68_01445 [Candidatus Taylorbacteria bacterium]|nr:hypothetical protein [Candidatus Taylorbacteria bacterium]
MFKSLLTLLRNFFTGRPMRFDQIRKGARRHDVDQPVCPADPNPAFKERQEIPKVS